MALLKLWRFDEAVDILQSLDEKLLGFPFKKQLIIWLQANIAQIYLDQGKHSEALFKYEAGMRQLNICPKEIPQEIRKGIQREKMHLMYPSKMISQKAKRR